MQAQTTSYRRSDRDIGQCAHSACAERAQYIIDMIVEGCESQTWTCPEHALPFGPAPIEHVRLSPHANESETHLS